MSTSSHKPWLSNLIDWIPGLHSTKPSMGGAKYTFTNRYNDINVLHDTLREAPFKFKSKDISIKASGGGGLKVTVPRKLTDEELERIDEAFYNAAYRRLEDDEDLE